jgi:glycosyltransferase involved in cell wall biosynthesis
MRILILNRVEPPAPGATGRLVAELRGYLLARGHQVQTITAGRLQPRVIPYALAWLGIGIRAMFAPRADCVLVMTDPPMLSAWIPFLKLRHRRVVHWCQDLYPDLLPLIGIKLPRLLQGFLEHLKHWAMNSTDQVIAIGRCMAEKLHAYADPKKIIIIPNWTEQSDSEKNRSATENFTAPFNILYAGNLGRAHPVEAIAAAIQSGADLPVQFVMMVSGQGEPVLRAALSGQANVSFLPSQTWDVAETVQRKAHLHLVALRPEATGLAIPVKYYAALRCGRPVVFLGSADSEIALHIAENHCGEAILPDAAARLADVIQSYVDAGGNPTAHWHDHVRAATRAANQLPDSLSLVAAAVLAQ